MPASPTAYRSPVQTVRRFFEPYNEPQPDARKTATVDLTFEWVCGGGDHINVGMRINGGEKTIYALNVSEILVSNTEELRYAMVLALMKEVGATSSAENILRDIKAGVCVTV